MRMSGAEFATSGAISCEYSASKYKLELPTAEELQKELEAERKRIEDNTEPKNLLK